MGSHSVSWVYSIVALLGTCTVAEQWDSNTKMGFPTQEQCDAAMGNMPGDACVFYTGGTRDSAKQYAADNGLVTLYSNPPNIAGWTNPDPDTPLSVQKRQDGSPWRDGVNDPAIDENDFWDCVSRSYTNLCTGRVVIISPSDGKWYQDSVLNRIEYPILKANFPSQVTQIVNIPLGQPETQLLPCPSGTGNTGASKRDFKEYKPPGKRGPVPSPPVPSPQWAARTRLYPIMPRFANTSITSTTTTDAGGVVPPPVTGTTITATSDDGSTITGVFTPTTLSDYSTLDSSTTITTSDSNGVPIIIPVGPHGIAWAPVGVIPALITPPPTPPTDIPGDGGDPDSVTDTSTDTDTDTTSTTTDSQSACPTVELVPGSGDDFPSVSPQADPTTDTTTTDTTTTTTDTATENPVPSVTENPNPCATTVVDGTTCSLPGMGLDAACQFPQCPPGRACGFGGGTIGPCPGAPPLNGDG